MFTIFEYICVAEHVNLSIQTTMRHTECMLLLLLLIRGKLFAMINNVFAKTHI